MSQHWYTKDGTLVDPWTKGAYPSVSTILDQVRSKSYEAMVARIGQEMADELMSAAAARGTRIHKACEDWLNVEPAVYEEGDLPYMVGFRNWWAVNKPTLVASEIFLLSTKYKYAGRADLVVEIDGQPWLIDIKTGVDSVRHGLQLKLYQQALLETLGIRARTGVLALDAKRSCGYRHSRAPLGLKEYKEPWTAAEAHIKVFKWWNKKSPITEPKAKEEIVWEPAL